MKRSRFHLTSLLCVSFLIVASCASSPPRGAVQKPSRWSGSTIVTTRFGAVQGAADADHTLVWKGIPYAAPPVGSLRWRAPQDAAPWSGVKSATAFGGACTQFSPIFAGSISGSEDCLYLNVWRPQDDAADLPVYVWIHGGGNSTGSSSMVADYYGNHVASREHMVYVSINYRLGPFGWFTHPALRDGASPEDASGNYGTLDMIKALGWIKDNITAFGGDPGNVTVTGESAGGFDVLSLLIAPPARGLFQRAMSESGAAITHGVDEADAFSQTVLERLLVLDGRARSVEGASGIAAGMTPQAARDYLRSKSDRQILRCLSSGAMGMSDNVAIIRDGVVIPSGGFDSLSAGTYPNKVPVILGSNKEEVKLFLYFSNAIPWKSDFYLAVSKYTSDRWKVSGVDEVARRLTSHADQPPVYAYQFSWGAPNAQGVSPLPGDWGRRLGAFHSLDVSFFHGSDTIDGFFQMFLATRQNESGRKALSAAMMDYAAQFARTGNPNAPDSKLPSWQPWTNSPDADKLIVFDVQGNEPAISMTSMEMTDEGVFASAKADLAEPERTHLMDTMEKSKMPSGVH